MGAPTTGSAVSTAGERLRREDCNHTKHDSAFSRWKILIGASDWRDYTLGKGSEKYRTQNLPNCASCPGVYELGVGAPYLRSGRENRALDSSDVIPVYLGQADNVRTRLQRYGREGAHLENECSSGKAKIEQRLGLFTDIFSRGIHIVYRWAPMETKKDAEKTESQLLDKFDYAWNKGSNGVRRPKDILDKLDRCAKESQFSLLSKKLHFFKPKKAGIRIPSFEPFLFENRGDSRTDRDNNSILSRILKIGRAQPILVSSPFGGHKTHTHICGVAIGHGSICTRVPVEGRKRCTEHRGMKVNGLVSKLKTSERKDPSFDEFQDQCVPADDDFAPPCGFILDSGSPCRNKPFARNKRCLDHKGRRVSRSAPKCSQANAQQQSNTPEDDGIMCGIDLGDGKPCRTPPVSGRKRCELHKGMRLKCSISR